VDTLCTCNSLKLAPSGDQSSCTAVQMLLSCCSHSAVQLFETFCHRIPIHHISWPVGLCNSEVHEEVSYLHLTGQICYTLVMKENATCIFT